MKATKQTQKNAKSEKKKDIMKIKVTPNITLKETRFVKILLIKPTFLKITKIP